jgi:hypothetical protein
VEPHLAEERVDWDNLSHGPTYEGRTEEEKEQKMFKAATER